MKRIIKQLEKKGLKLTVILNQYDYKYIVSKQLGYFPRKFKTLTEIKEYYSL